MNLTKMLFVICVVVFLSASFFSCKDDDIDPIEEPSIFNPILDNFFVDDTFAFNRELSFDLDRVKIAISSSLSSLFNDDRLAEMSFRELVLSQDKGRILAVNFNTMTLGDKSLLDLIVDNLNDADSDLEGTIENLCELYPHLSLSLPIWVKEIPADVVVASEWVVFPVLSTREENFWRGIRFSDDAMIAQVVSKPFEFIPLQIKEAEDLIPYREGDLSTIWNDMLIDDHFPIVKECNEMISSLPEFSIVFPCNNEYKFLQIIEFRDHLRNTCFLGDVEACFNSVDDDDDGLVDTNDTDCDGINPFEICNNLIDDDGDGLIDEEDKDCLCSKIYERDCNNEINVMRNISIPNARIFLGISNIPGGEDIISLQYVFVASTFCGDLNVSSVCPANTWSKIFYGARSEFFEIQEMIGSPGDSGENLATLFIDASSNRYWNLNSTKFEIPIFNDQGLIYAQSSYLEPSLNGNYDADIFGSGVVFSIIEHDNLIVNQVIPGLIQINNSPLVTESLQKNQVLVRRDEAFSSFTFSNVLKPTSHNIEVDFSRDFNYGQSASLYFDPNFENEQIGFGINKTTGLVNTTFAFYTR